MQQESKQQQRQLGNGGPMVGAIGLGCMSFAGFYGATDRDESLATLAAAADLGVTHLDTAIVYGMGLSESIIGEFIAERPGVFTIASKCGIVVKPERSFDNSRDYIRQALEGSLERLGLDRVDLYYLHRRDERVPIQTAIESMAELVDEGLIGGIGLSEVAPSTLEQASAVHPIAAVQSEYSLWTRLPELGVIQACQRLGTAFVSFSPVGRGAFADVAPDPAAFGETDFRRRNPRFSEDNYPANRAHIDKFRAYAHDRGMSSAALAVAWVLAQGDHIITIPGTRSVEHLEQLMQATAINLTAADLADIEAILPVGFAHGFRYAMDQVIGTALYC